MVGGAFEQILYQGTPQNGTGAVGLPRRRELVEAGNIRQSGPMKDLSKALRLLRREIEAGLLGADSENGGMLVQPEQVTVALTLVGKSDGPDLVWEVATGGSVAGPVHSLTIQFRVGSTAGPTLGATPATAEQSLEVLPKSPREGILKACESIFGAPGFDNAARAEVFCELVDQHPLPALRSALTAVAGGQPQEAPPVHLTSRLRQLLGFAPVGREAAALELQRLLQEISPTELRGVIAERWRFGTHWGERE